MTFRRANLRCENQPAIQITSAAQSVEIEKYLTTECGTGGL
jgi:hypothetical protein